MVATIGGSWCRKINLVDNRDSRRMLVHSPLFVIKRAILVLASVIKRAARSMDDRIALLITGGQAG
jgi:hypothetical protein